MCKLDLPNLDAIDRAVVALSTGAGPAAQRALTKARYHLHLGIALVAVPEGVLVPSSTGDAVYTVTADASCSCPASKRCYHAAMIEILIEAQSRPAMPRLTTQVLLDPPPGDDEPGIGDGEGDEAPEEYRIDPARIIHALKVRGVSVPRTLNQTANESVLDLFG